MAPWSEHVRRFRLERGLTQEELARELGRIAWEQQHVQVGVDAAMVSKWERGTKQPSRRYQRLLRALAGTGSAEPLERADLDRRAFLRNALFAVGASVAPSRDWLVETIEVATAPVGRVTNERVTALRRTFGIFQEMDVMRGGGHSRNQLAGYVSSVVVPLLRENSASTAAGRALHEAGAEQLYLLGWMAYDDGEHALAQRHLLHALRLAQDARSPALGAHVLAGLSDQATLTGHPDHGLQLARTGRAGLGATRSHACLADLWALQARAEAALGDAKAAARSVARSEREAAAVVPDDEPEWARFIDAAYLNGEYAHALRDVGRPRESARFAALSAADAARQHRARRGSLAHAALARSALATHDLEAAAAAGVRTVELAVSVRSSRSAEAAGDVRRRLAAHTNSPPVRDFVELADSVMPPVR
jgi:transcriptional regulator with XRE-family HTH domain